MFGHNDNNQKQDDAIGSAHDDIAAAAEAIANDRSLQGSTAPTGGTLGSFMATPGSTPAVVSPVGGISAAATPAAPTDDQAQPDPVLPAGRPDDTGAMTPRPSAAPDADGLLSIKQEALQALTPLVSQLEQTPEEQFRTTMMMIQASDNHSLVKTAYEAAQKISNEKERAQALLDIVNEINYFTQQP